MGGRAGGRACAWRRDALRSRGAGDARAEVQGGGLGRTVCRTAGQAGGQPGGRTALCTDGRAGGRPGGRRGGLSDGGPGARTGGQAGGHIHS